MGGWLMRTQRIVGVTLLITLWALAAAIIVGPLDVVTTHGISMAPRFHDGDLAIIRSTADYEVGDIIVYRSTALQKVVMHRIVAEEDGRYTLLGDNNAWADPERPTRDQFIGKLVLRIPQGRTWLQRGTLPVVLSIIVFGLLSRAAKTRGLETQLASSVLS